jgi:hypothetical protein
MKRQRPVDVNRPAFIVRVPPSEQVQADLSVCIVPITAPTGNRGNSVDG